MTAKSCAFGLEFVDWGSLPDWIAGIAAGGALWLAFSGWKIARQEQHEAAADRRQREYRERRAHAQQFTCWADSSSLTELSGRTQHNGTVCALNPSQWTYLNVELKATAQGVGGWRETARTSWSRLTPNQHGVAEQRHLSITHEDSDTEPSGPTSWTTEALFTDKDGVRWHYKNGSLDEATEQIVAAFG